MRVPRKSEPEYYLDQVLPILIRRRVLQLTKFDYRLTNELDEELQRLRCRVNYHALRFTKPIRSMGQKLVMRMRKMEKRFIAVHLRFAMLFVLNDATICLSLPCLNLICWHFLDATMVGEIKKDMN
nr:O-fucosyltransferase 29-like [Ipomoea batatas]GMC87286.1 O-fucosyltransferase 29-like [Ipomoea batatas]